MSKPDAAPVIDDGEPEGAMSRMACLRGMVVLAALLVASCTSPLEPTASGHPTVAPSTGPTRSAIPSTSTVASAARATEVIPTTSPTSAAPVASPTAIERLETITFTVVYDNNSYDPQLRTSWGFACWVETDEVTVLFDTGGDGPTLMGNLDRLGLAPEQIDAVVLSHAHGDHTGGLGSILNVGARPTVYIPASFSESFRNDVRAHAPVVMVTEAETIAPGIHTTGEIQGPIPEQALVVQTHKGLVVVTGCAHPGVVDIVRRAKGLVGGQVALVMGGFHLSGASSHEIETIIDELRHLDVRRVAPCHCTGDQAREAFVDAFRHDAVLAGVGWSTEYLAGKDDKD